MLVCPACRTPLIDGSRCPTCDVTYPIDDGIVDFARGEYYDQFDPSDVLSPEHRAGLELELEGTRRRIVDFYLPLMPPGAKRILDCGCGNGLSVDLLAERGFEAWGNDLSQLRKWQWRERRNKNRLVVASGTALPFPDGFFDVVISSGVIEHIGVAETAVPHFAVTPLPDRDERRREFLRELLRVARGEVFLDCPNGGFPIDFWHGDSPGSPRRHPRQEGFLPTFAEIRALVRDVAPGARVRALSPFRRLQFHQARGHRHRHLAGPASLFFRLMKVAPFIAGTALNPFLVIRISPAPAHSRSRDRRS